jgi:putative two-component system response regulator
VQEHNMNEPEHHRPRVAVVGDAGGVWPPVRDWLEPHAQVEWPGTGPADLVLVDASGPAGEGRLVSARQAPLWRGLPLVVLAGEALEPQVESWLSQGVADVILPPWSERRVLARLLPLLQVRQLSALLREGSRRFDAELQHRTREAAHERDALLWTLALLAERRDNETARHLLRMQGYVRVLGLAWRRVTGRGTELDDHRLELLVRATPLHDLGKLEVPRHLLRKPGRLTAEEFAIVKTHTTRGHELLARAQAQLGEPCELLTMAQEVALTHLERWDGSGYPRGLAGEAIPLAGRLVALATVYDALISRRSYKEPLPHDAAVAVISGCRGSHFDPDVVTAFERSHEGFREVAQLHADDEAEMRQLFEDSQRQQLEEWWPAGGAPGPGLRASRGAG